MGRSKTLGIGLAWLAVMGMAMPIPALSAAERPAPPRPAMSDIALTPDGTLQGQVLSPQGVGTPGLHVAVSSGSRQLASTVTGKDGRFQIRGLKGGVLTLTTGQTQSAVRVWTAKAAPPAARDNVLLVAGQSQALGQSWSGFKKVATNPWVIAGVVAAAVAIPVAIHNADDDDPASP